MDDKNKMKFVAKWKLILSFDRTENYSDKNIITPYLKINEYDP